MNEKAATNSSLRRFLRKPAEGDPTTADIWKESKVVEKLDDDGTEVTYHRMDMIWGSLQEKLPNLSKVALAV